MNKRHLTIHVNLRGVDLTEFLNKANRLIDRDIDYNHDTVHLQWAGQFENQHRAYKPSGGSSPFGVGDYAAVVVWLPVENSARRL